jgi:hypothetical protein
MAQSGFGHNIALTQRRATALDAAFAANPNRFKHVTPSPPVLHIAAWINPPKKDAISIIATSGRSLN